MVGGAAAASLGKAPERGPPCRSHSESGGKLPKLPTLQADTSADVGMSSHVLRPPCSRAETANHALRTSTLAADRDGRKLTLGLPQELASPAELEQVVQAHELVQVGGARRLPESREAGRPWAQAAHALPVSRKPLKAGFTAAQALEAACGDCASRIREKDREEGAS